MEIRASEVGFVGSRSSISKLGFWEEIWWWRRTKWGSEGRADHDLQTDLKRRRDLMGRRARIWRIRSFGREMEMESDGGFIGFFWSSSYQLG